MIDEAENKCLYARLPMPPEFEEDDWKLDYNETGRLCRLTQCNTFKLWMGNDYAEERDMIYGALRMHGHCLVLGLGIGLVAQYIDVVGVCKSITIIENSPIVIKHIGPWLKENIKIPLEIIQSDDLEFLKNTDRKWDTMYADTWEKCTDALKKIEKLKLLSKGKVRGKKIYWCEKELKKELKRTSKRRYI